ncbi:MAG TPA: ECF transporter S component [Firmicutes bacterium]|nr:ECF transporter S component [Bacillota bacterium]
MPSQTNTKLSVRKMVIVAMFAAIIFLLGFTPLGMIPVTPVIKATILHIPVIIGACLLGPKIGGILGFVFGLVSFINNSFISPSITSFVFTPFYSLNPEYQGNLWSLVICFVPRILVGVCAGWVYAAICRREKSGITAGAVAGVLGSLINTLLVLGGIWLFFGNAYAEIAGKSMMAVIIGAISANGAAEAVLAGVMTPLIVRPLKKAVR